MASGIFLLRGLEAILGTYHIVRTPEGRFRFTLSANTPGAVLVGVAHDSIADVLQAIHSCRMHGPLEGNYQRESSHSGSYSYSLHRFGGATIASGPLFTSAEDRDRAIVACMVHSATSPTQDDTGGKWAQALPANQ